MGLLLLNVANGFDQGRVELNVTTNTRRTHDEDATWQSPR